MKKQLLALVVALSTTVSFAATAPQAQGSNPAQGTPFEKAEQLYNQKIIQRLIRKLIVWPKQVMRRPFII